MIETWRKCLDENKIVGATLTDLSKAFNCLPHVLLVAKLEAYGLDTKTLKLMLSYLSGCKQCVKIRNSFSLLKLILFDIPHGSILEPIFFNIFMNDIFFLLGSDLHNFADDNTVTAVAETIQDLINSLEVKTRAQFICRAAAVPNQIGRIKFGSSTVAARRMNRAQLIKFGSAVLTTFSANSSTLARW